MASGGYVILDIKRVKSWTVESGYATGKIDGVYKQLTITEKPILIHNLNKVVIPDTTLDYSDIVNDFFTTNPVEKTSSDTHGNGIHIDFGQDIYVYEDDTIQIG